MDGGDGAVDRSRDCFTTCESGLATGRISGRVTDQSHEPNCPEPLHAREPGVNTAYRWTGSLRVLDCDADALWARRFTTSWSLSGRGSSRRASYIARSLSPRLSRSVRPSLGWWFRRERGSRCTGIRLARTAETLMWSPRTCRSRSLAQAVRLQPVTGRSHNGKAFRLG